MKKAVYPGSFDPITYGHLDLIKRGLEIADKLVIAVLVNPMKQPLFATEERVEMVKRAVKGLRRVEVDHFDGLLVDYLKRKGSSTVIRGLRAISDFEYEFQMALMNRRLSPKAETVFMMPAEPYTYLSSNIVREIARRGGKVNGLVPSHVVAALRARLGPRRT